MLNCHSGLDPESSHKNDCHSREGGNPVIKKTVIPDLIRNPVIKKLISFWGAVAQLGERSAGSAEVRGSIPLGSTIIFISY